MRTSLTEIKEIEDYISHRMQSEDALVFEAHLLVDAERRKNLKLQLQAYELIHKYGQSQLKEELCELQQQLFTAPKYYNFQQQIFSLFKK